MYNNLNNKTMAFFKVKYKSQIKHRATEEGESIEQMLRRVLKNNEPIPENVPPIYTPEKEGVQPDYDIRTDRFDVAMQAGDKFAASERAKSADTGKTFEQEQEQDKNE